MKGYKTSKDYKRLKELLDGGYKIPAVYQNTWLCMFRHGTWYICGEYITMSVYSPSVPFDQACEQLHLEFIEPGEDTDYKHEFTAEDLNDTYDQGCRDGRDGLIYDLEKRLQDRNEEFFKALDLKVKIAMGWDEVNHVPLYYEFGAIDLRDFAKWGYEQCVREIQKWLNGRKSNEI